MRCSHCGISGIRVPGDERILKMPPELAISISGQLHELRWMPRIIVSGRGEPTLHPELDVLIGALYHGMSGDSRSVTVMTGGAGLLPAPGPAERILAYFEAGLSCLVVGEHASPQIAESVRDNAYLLSLSGIHVHERMRGIRKWDVDRRFHARERLILLPQPGHQSAAQGSRETTNQGLSSGSAVAAVRKRCLRPTAEMTVLWDGTVALCENDWYGVHTVGHVDGVGLGQVWSGEKMQAARRLTYHNQRSQLFPCSVCSDTAHVMAGRYVPDHELPPALPTEDDVRVAQLSVSHPPHTPPPPSGIPAFLRRAR